MNDLPVRYQAYEINRNGSCFVIWDKINKMYLRKDGDEVVFFTKFDEANERVKALESI